MEKGLGEVGERVLGMGCLAFGGDVDGRKVKWMDMFRWWSIVQGAMYVHLLPML